MKTWDERMGARLRVERIPDGDATLTNLANDGRWPRSGRGQHFEN
jgi:hypothetical protein